jgi:hypothetical protein
MSAPEIANVQDATSTTSLKVQEVSLDKESNRQFLSSSAKKRKPISKSYLAANHSTRWQALVASGVLAKGIGGYLTRQGNNQISYTKYKV